LGEKIVPPAERHCQDGSQASRPGEQEYQPISFVTQSSHSYNLILLEVT
jgi:hypothetical protein